VPNSKRNRIRWASHAITTKQISKVAAGWPLSMSDIMANMIDAIPDASSQEISEVLKED
jgi:hypothetical protein